MLQKSDSLHSTVSFNPTQCLSLVKVFTISLLSFL